MSHSALKIRAKDRMSSSLTADSVPVYDYLACLAAENLDTQAVYVLHDSSAEEDVKLRSVTWRHLLSAVYSRATEIAQLTSLPPRSHGDAPFVVGLLAHNGYAYLVTWLALFKLRWTPLLISPQNSSEAVLHLLNTTGAQCLLLDTALTLRYQGLPTDSFQLSVLPAFDLTNLDVESSEATQSLLAHAASIKSSDNADALRAEARGVCMYMHTSGSTGHPKAIAWPHEFVNNKMLLAARDYPGGQGRVMYSPLPIYHGGGFCMSLPIMAGYGGIITLVEPYHAVSADSVLRHLRILKDKKPDVLFVPNLLEDIVESLPLSEALEYLRIPNIVLQGGAPLRQDVGAKLAHGGVHIVTWGGITEAGVFASMAFDPTRDPADWQYMRLVDGYEFNFMPFNAEHPDQGYQLVMSPKIITPPLINHENPRGFLLPDIWMRHPDPSKSDLWKIAGRLDDIIVLSNGEKANGKQIENLLYASPFVSNAVIFGAGRFLCGALVRPSAEYKLRPNDKESKEAYLAKLRAYTDAHINTVVPRHSRLLHPLVLVEDPSKPFLFSDKGTVKMKAALDLYHDEIEAAYKAIEDGTGTAQSNAAASLDFTNTAAVTEFIRSLLVDALGRDISDEDDFFNSGLDSLLAVNVRFAIVTALKDAQVIVELPRNVIYANPTTASLVHYLQSLVSASNSDITDATWSALYRDEVSATAMVDEAIARFSTGFAKRTSPPANGIDIAGGDVYAVTGTTGSLGSTFLSALLSLPVDKVKRVYMLNRTTKVPVEQRHKASFVKKNLDYSVVEKAVKDGRAVFLDTDVTKEKLGIDSETYNKMAAELTQIVHNAWPVTFTYHFKSFIPQLAGLRALIDLALLSPHAEPPHLVFMSSISVAGRHLPGDEAIIPETPLTSVTHALPHGYAFSKFAAEKILERTTSSTALRVSIVRSGQIAGSLSTGAWNKHEYLPSILRASVHAGKVPDDLFSAAPHWLPVESAAQVLYAITQARASVQIQYYGFENTRPIPWTSVISTLLTLYPSLHEAPALEWLASVRALQDETVIDGALLDYIEEFICRKSLPRLATANTEGISEEVRKLVDFDFTENEAIVEKYIQFAIHG
ncbi:acetyl-CoA synthetase-like protein [Trametopsis cervina]|nr:acetyl-CoA synthetase-like protein [Trametopsis cervina]